MQPRERAGDEVVFQGDNFNWEEVLYTVLFIFSPGRAVHSQTRLKRSESQQWWSSLKNPATEMFKGRRIQFVARRYPYLDGMSLRKRLIIWSDHIWFTKADFPCIAWFALVEIT